MISHFRTRFLPISLTVCTFAIGSGCFRNSDAVAPVGTPAEASAQTPAEASAGTPAAAAFPLAALRASQRSTLSTSVDTSPPAQPPEGELQIVRYPSELGENVAYLSPIPQDGALHPAVVWITGGFDWGIGEWAWRAASPENDQSARQFRDAGIVTLYPAPRGSNGNLGLCELMYGEVTDFIAAGAWLATQPGIDPQRVYLAGHSTGGTVALLAAESTAQFRAVFALGPASNALGYSVIPEYLPEDEIRARSPRWWLNDIVTPTWVIEGEYGNADSLGDLDSQTDNPNVHFERVAGHDHFSIIVPALTAISAAILADTGPTPTLNVRIAAAGP